MKRQSYSIIEEDRHRSETIEIALRQHLPDCDFIVRSSAEDAPEDALIFTSDVIVADLPRPTLVVLFP